MVLKDGPWLNLPRIGGKKFIELASMKSPVVFLLLTFFVLAVASFICFIYGLPLLNQPAECDYGGGLKSFGCATPFGTFMTFLSGGAALTIAAIWNRFGR